MSTVMVNGQNAQERLEAIEEDSRELLTEEIFVLRSCETESNSRHFWVDL